MPGVRTKRQAAGALLAMAVAAMTVAVACSSGAGKSNGPATVHVSASPNGEASKTGPQVLADATNALASVPVVRLTGTQTTEGETQQIELRVQSDGVTGSVQTPSGTEQLLAVDGKFYLKNLQALGGPSLLPKALASALQGRWFYIDPSDNGGMNAGGSADEPMNIKGFAAGLRQLDKGVTVDPAVTTDTVNGQQAVVVSESDGTRLYVSATGEPLPLKVVGKNNDEDAGLAALGEVTFSYGDDPVQLRAPSGAVSLQKTFEQILPSAFPSDFPSGFPTDLPSAFPSAFATAFPSGFPSVLPSGFPTALPSGLPSALVSALKSFESAGSGEDSGPIILGSPVPSPTP